MLTALFLILKGVLGIITLAHDGTTVTTILSHTFTVDSSSPPVDTCHKLWVGKKGLHHLNSQSTAQHWPMSDLTINYTIYFAQNITSNVTAFGLTNGQNYIDFLDIGNNTISNYKLQGSLLAPNFQNSTSFTAISPPSDYFNSGKSYLFFKNYLGSSSDNLQRLSPNTDYPLPSLNGRISLSPDKKILAVINLDSTIYFLNASADFTSINTYTPSTPPPSGSTHHVSFDSTNTLAIIETDSHNPITIYNVILNSIVFQVNFSDTIYGARFIQDSQEFFLVMGSSGNYLIDSRDSTNYTIGQMSTSSVYDWQSSGSTVYQCLNNTISQYLFQFTPSTPAEEEYIIVLNMTQNELKTIQSVSSVVTTITQYTKDLVTFIVSSPVAVLFLSLINFFNLSSLYVFLNFPIPQHVYLYIQHMYNSLNGNFYRLIGSTHQFKMISTQKIHTKKALSLGVSSDVLSFNSEIFLIIATNFLLLFIVQLIVSRLRKSHRFKKIFDSNKRGFIYGQIINTFIQFTLPWSFILLQTTSFTTFGNKMNLLMFFVSLFLVIHFPIIYFFILVDQQKQIFLKSRTKVMQKPRTKVMKKVEVQPPKEVNEFQFSKNVKLVLPEYEQVKVVKQPTRAKKSHIKQLKVGKVALKQEVRKQESVGKQVKIQKPAIKVNCLKPAKKAENQKSAMKLKMQKAQKEIEPQFSFQELLTAQVWLEWFVCLANFIYPLLVLLDSALFFLVVVGIFTVLNLIVAWKDFRADRNGFFLTIYPVLYHICFIFFRFSTSEKVLIYAAMICLVVLLIGSTHNALTLILTILYYIFTFVKSLCTTNQVEDSQQQTSKSTKKDNKKKSKPSKSMPKQKELKGGVDMGIQSRERRLNQSLTHKKGLSGAREEEKTNYITFKEAIKMIKVKKDKVAQARSKFMMT